MSLADDIGRLLDQRTSEQLLKWLFWELLEYDPVDDPVPYSAIPQDRRGRIIEGKVLARSGSVCVCYLELAVSELQYDVERPLLDCLHGVWPSVLVIFSSFAGKEIDLSWRNGDHVNNRTRRLCLDLSLYSPNELAHMLSKLAAHPTTNDTGASSSLELMTRIDRMFRSAPIRRRKRPKLSSLDHFLRVVSAPV